MKISYSLCEEEKLIIRILSIKNWLNVEDLESLISSIDKYNIELDEYIKSFKKPVRVRKPRRPGFKLRDYNPFLTEKHEDLHDKILKLSHLDVVTWKSTDPEMKTLPSSANRKISFGLTSQGQRIAKIIRENRQILLRAQQDLQITVFIACAFDNTEINSLYTCCLEPACESLGYKPIRVDMIEPQYNITNTVIESIQESAAIIADLTHARQSVYFEVGLSHGLGIPLVLTCRADHRRGIKDTMKVHFDLEQYKISYWIVDQSGKFIWENHMDPLTRLSTILENLQSP
jgi:nucleoside 2-deoxyribosyltransferase